MDICASEGCSNPSRWPRPRRRIGYCHGCLTRFATEQSATVLRLGDHARARFRVRHHPCGAITDVSLPMLRRGWACRTCKLTGMTARGWVQNPELWSLERQEQLLTVAGFRPLRSLADNCYGDYPLNVECERCGGAQSESLFGISEGVRLSWLPCTFCNADRFKPDETTIRERFLALGLELCSPWTGDPGAALEARCRRCGNDRAVSWAALATAPPCLRCDGRRLDPEAPHRVYLFEFQHLGDCGVYKVGITHSVDDRRLAQHQAVGGRLIQVVNVPDRASAFAIEAAVLRRFRAAAPAYVLPADLPYGGATECWDAAAGYPDLTAWIPVGGSPLFD